MNDIKKLIFFALILLSLNSLKAQKYFTKTGEVTFFSHAPLEDIKAVSNTGSSVIDGSNGKIQWAVLIKSFAFAKALMQEHFNENYMESTKFPKAKFTGVIDNMSDIDLKVDGEYPAQISGVLEIHGKEKKIKTSAKFLVAKGKIIATSTFKVLLVDFGIEIPSVVNEKIAKEVEISIKSNYELLDKM